MRKNKLIIVVVITAIVLAGCGSAASTKTSTSTSVGKDTVSVSETIKVEDKTETSKEEEQGNGGSVLTKEFGSPDAEFYINVPAWQEIEEGKTEIFRLGELEYINISSNKFVETNTLEDAFKNGTDIMVTNLNTYFRPQELVVDKSEVVTINGIEMYKYEGHINCSESQPYEAPCFGYSMIIDGIAFDINGSIHGKDGYEFTYIGETEVQKFDKEAAVAEMREIIDEMATTIRTTK